VKAVVATIVLGSVLVLPMLPRLPQDPCYHDFADQRGVWGIPHFWNVVSNLPLVIVGAIGLWVLRRPLRGLGDPRERLPWVLLSGGCLLTGLGSTWYHLSPDNGTLMWDRLPLGVTSIAVALIVLQETVSLPWVRRITWPVVLFAAASTPWWYISESHGDGDLRGYAWCTAAPVLAVLAGCTVLSPRYSRARAHLWVAVAFYVGARLTELGDHEVDALPLLWSGHTWKHLLAAGTVATLLRWLVVREPLEHVPPWPPAPPPSPMRSGAAFLLWAAVFYVGASAAATEMLLHPRRVRPTPPTDAASVETFELTASDGTPIAAWFLDTRDARGTVILLHGMGACRNGPEMEQVVAHGYRALAIDLRAHGESGGDMTSFGRSEGRDVDAAADWVRERFPTDRVAAWGRSLGGAAIACSQARTTFDAIVFESVYADLATAYDNRLLMHLPAWLTWSGAGIRWCAELRLGFSADHLDLAEDVRGIDGSRVLIATGSADLRATPGDSRRLAASLPGSRLVLVPGAHHENLWRTGGDGLRTTVFQFLRERMR